MQQNNSKSIIVFLLLLVIIILLYLFGKPILVKNNIYQYIGNQNQQVRIFNNTQDNNLFILVTIGKDCVSCHQNWVYVFDNNGKKIFETDSSNALINKITNDGFSIKETLTGNALFKIRTFKWINDNIIEIKTDTNISK